MVCTWGRGWVGVEGRVGVEGCVCVCVCVGGGVGRARGLKGG